MLGFEFVIGLASMLAETVFLWKRLYGLSFPHIKACGQTAVAAARLGAFIAPKEPRWRQRRGA